MFSLKDVKMKPKQIGLFLAVGIIPLALMRFWDSIPATNIWGRQRLSGEKTRKKAGGS